MSATSDRVAKQNALLAVTATGTWIVWREFLYDGVITAIGAEFPPIIALNTSTAVGRMTANITAGAIFLLISEFSAVQFI
jgi:hypothetical protein